MNKAVRWVRVWGCVAALSLLAAGCESNAGPKAERDVLVATDPPAREGFPKITLDTAAYPRLGEAVRQIGETTGGGIVLLAGMEEIPVAPTQLNAVEFVNAVKQLTSLRPCTVQPQKGYVLVYPPGYEELSALSVAEYLPPGLASGRANVAIGAGTRLPNALALLSDAFDTAVVADNVVAEAWCGELYVEGAGFSASLEAILQSALVLPSAIDIVAEEDYVFIRSRDNTNRAPALLNSSGITQAQRNRLAAKVNVRLPESTGGVAFAERYMPLAKVLPVLTSQLDAEITADPGMADFPVDAVVLNSVSLENALNLIVWQWPLPRFGYRATPDGFHFCQREG